MTGSGWEGWFTDPFGRHEARWLSGGKPTDLVRDGDVESYDEPPTESLSTVPELIDDASDDPPTPRPNRATDYRGSVPVFGVAVPKVQRDQYPLRVSRSRTGQAFAKLPRVARWLIGLLALILGIFGVFWLVNTLTNEQPPLFTQQGGDFNDATTLESSLQQQLDANLKDPANAAYRPRTTVLSTICNPSASDHFKCVVALSNGKSQILSITVSGDGSHWKIDR